MDKIILDTETNKDKAAAAAKNILDKVADDDLLVPALVLLSAISRCIVCFRSKGLSYLERITNIKERTQARVVYEYERGCL